MTNQTALIEKEKEIIARYPNYEINSKYNVFEVLDIQRKEVIMCRFLADLLNPNGKHGQGSLFLKEFLEIVLDMKDEDEKLLESTQVITEYPIDRQDENSKRRIDIVISSAKHFIPIEVKIYAEEQEHQCYDYFKFAEKIDKNTKIVYLTRFGSEPSSYSRLDLKKGEFVTKGWSNDIVPWILKSMKSIQDDKLKYVLEQYIDAIYQIANERKEKKMDESKDLILKTPENLEAAICIDESLKKAKVQLIKQLFEEFEKQMNELCKKEEYKFLSIETKSHYHYYKNKENEKYYDGSASTYPGISYVVNNPNGNIFSNENLELWFRIELDYNLFAGFTVFDKSLKDSEKHPNGCEVGCIDNEISKEATEFLGLESINSNCWWLMWCYSDGTTSESERVPNFKKINKKAIMLTDEQTRKDFVTETISCFEKELLKYIPKPDLNEMHE